MKTLTTPVSTEAAADQSGWVELYDIYLKKAIATPFGVTDVIRICNGAKAVAFFAPAEFPEPVATQGSAQTYQLWNIQRQQIAAKTKFANDKLTVAASNVTGEWATMLATVNWDAVPIVIRKVPTSSSSTLVAADADMLFNGKIDSADVTLEQLTFSCSNDLADLATNIPREDMHSTCRFRFGDDFCTQIPLRAENYKAKTAGSGSTAQIVCSDDFDEDSAIDGGAAITATADAGTDKISETTPPQNGDLVRFTATAMPGGLTAGTDYYVINRTSGDYQVALTHGGSAVNITSAGTALKRHSLYGPDLVNQLTSDKITTSSEQSGHQGYRLRMQEADDSTWEFAVKGDNPTPDVDIYSPYIQFDFGSGTEKALRWANISAGAQNDPDVYRPRTFTVLYSSDGTNFTSVGTLAPSFSQNTRSWTMIWGAVGAWRYWRIVIKLSDGGPFLNDVCGTIKAALSNLGTDVIDPLSNDKITTSLEVTGYEGYRVQSGVGGTWRVNDPGSGFTKADFETSDWGYAVQGYWQIPDDQAGLANPLLKPYIQFDFGGDKALKVWRFRALAGSERQDIPRLIQIFSSSDPDFEDDVVLESYFQLPPRGGQFFDCLIPLARAKRYWRICIRSTWAEALNYVMFNKIQAFEGSRNYWTDGYIKFDDDTATAALQNVIRAITRSYDGLIYCEELPAVPANGDTFIVQRGCNRAFNKCCSLRNIENFGGFDTLPEQTVVR